MEALRRGTLLVTLPLLLLLAAACGGTQPVGDSAPDATAPMMEQLSSLLAAELAARGIDPARTTSRPPAFTGNQPFDLQVEIIDPDGEGPMPEASFRLTWTERLTGDYNQDGVVGLADLTPIAQNFMATVIYDDPALHNGFVAYPSGDPLDDGGVPEGSPPVAGSGAHNWRLARMDGNRDGVIQLPDVTPIAQHFSERLEGYIIRRKATDATEWETVPHPTDPDSPVTIKRSDLIPEGESSIDSTRPVRYEFVDVNVEELVSRDYYVMPYGDGAPAADLP
jgi:hypothetical protein